METARPFAIRWAWVAFAQLLCTPLAGYYAGEAAGAPWLWNWLTPVWVFAIFPLLDTWVGLETRNPAPADEARLAADALARALPIAALPACAALLAWGAPRFAALLATDAAAALGLAVSIGIVGGAIGITYAHELVHKPSAFERNAGGLLLSLVAYGGFKVEHVFGHHVDVATPRDTSTARLGQSAYGFLLRSFLVNPVRAWELAGRRVRARGLPAWHWRNEMYVWHGLTLAWIAGLGAWLGSAGIAYFCLQAFVAIALLELVNYVEHYGLLRRTLPGGGYERVTPRHSWNDSHKLSNLVLLNLQRHSDHHAHAARRYTVLRHHDDAPQLPTGYASLILLALAPPLWRRFMDPRVAAWEAATAATPLTP